MSTENKQKRPKYTLEFKKDAAKLVFEKGYTQEQAANNPGISKSAANSLPQCLVRQPCYCR
jgi:transposase